MEIHHKEVHRVNGGYISPNLGAIHANHLGATNPSHSLGLIKHIIEISLIDRLR